MKFSEALEDFIDCKEEYDNPQETMVGLSSEEMKEEQKRIKDEFSRATQTLDKMFDELTNPLTVELA